MSASAKRQIIAALDELPDQSVTTVAEFVESLRAKTIGGPRTPAPHI